MKVGRWEPRGCGWGRAVIVEVASAEKVAAGLAPIQHDLSEDEVEGERGTWGLPGHIYFSWRNSLLYLRRKHMTGTKRVKHTKKTEESMFCCLASDSLKRATHKPSGTLNLNMILPDNGHIQKPQMLSTHLPLLFYYPPHFSPQLAFSLGTCSKLKSKSVPSRETRNMCMSPLLERLLITSLLNLESAKKSLPIRKDLFLQMWQQGTFHQNYEQIMVIKYKKKKREREKISSNQTQKLF